MIPMAYRIADVGTSIFTEMSALAARHGAVNLGQGFPDFPGPEFIKAAARAAIDANQNQYAPTNGLPAFQQAAAAEWQRRYGRTLDPTSEITVTSGATEALLVSILAFTQPGDEVILLEPYYDSYPAQVRMAGAKPVFVRMHAPDFELDIDAVKNAITSNTRAIILNTPQNPCGRVLSKRQLQELSVLCIANNLLVISDEVYERLVFAPHVHTPMAMVPGMWDRTITIHSTGKTFSMTGWKVGYTVAAPRLSNAIRRVHQFCTFTTATPLQAAIVEGFKAGAVYEAELLDFYAQRRDELCSALQAAGFEVHPPQGTYFVMAGYKHLKDLSDIEFCRWLTSEIGVAAIPPGAFFHDGHQTGMVRFCFAKKPETIAAASEKLQKLR